MAEPPPPPPPLGDGVEIIDAQVQVASTDYRDMANNINNQQQNNNTNANANGNQQQEPMIGPQPPPEGMQQQEQQENMPDQHILQLWNDVAQNLREHQTGKFFYKCPNQRSH